MEFGKDLLGSANAPPSAAMLVSPKRVHAAENIEAITSKSCRQPYMLPSGVIRPGIAPGWPGNNTVENLPWCEASPCSPSCRRSSCLSLLYTKPLVHAVDPAAGQYSGESIGAELFTGAVNCPTIFPEGLIPLAMVGRVPVAPTRALGTSMVVNCSPFRRKPCCCPTASV